MSAIQIIETSQFDRLASEAAQGPRLRINHNFHGSMEDNPHRFLNVMLQGTYLRPHRHLLPPKSESFVVLEGSLAFIIFDESGRIAEGYELSAGGPVRGIDIGPGIWHTVFVLSERCVCFEVKPGPYRVSDDKEFAAWAPAEGDPSVPAFQENLLLSWQNLQLSKG